MADAPKRIEICKFPGNKRLAFTTSWDDGVVDDRPVVKVLNQLGIKGTFNLNSGKLGRTGRIRALEETGWLDASEVAELYRGHEVAIHTVSHPHLPMLDPSQIALEVLDDRRALEDLVGYPVRGMAYPFGTVSPKVIEILRGLGIVYCRAVGNLEVCFPPAEPLLWQSTMHIFHENPPLPERFKLWLDNKRRNDAFFVWGHSYEFGKPRVRWDDIEKLFAPCAGHAEVWYCTNIELFDYEAARQRMVIAANKRTAYNPSALTVTLSVDGKLQDVPAGKTVAIEGGGSV